MEESLTDNQKLSLTGMLKQRHMHPSSSKGPTVLAPRFFKSSSPSDSLSTLLGVLKQNNVDM